MNFNIFWKKVVFQKRTIFYQSKIHLAKCRVLEPKIYETNLFLKNNSYFGSFFRIMAKNEGKLVPFRWLDYFSVSPWDNIVTQS